MGLELEASASKDKCPLATVWSLLKNGMDVTAFLRTKLSNPLTKQDRGSARRIAPQGDDPVCSSVQASWLELATGLAHPKGGKKSSKSLCKHAPLLDTISLIDWHLNLQPSRLNMDEHPFARLAAQAWPAN